MIKKVLLLVGTISLLNGCAILAVGAVGAAATGASVATDRRASESVFTDNSIQTKLVLKYGDTSKFPAESANIYVDVYNRKVLLTGQVKTDTMKDEADFIARSYPGVIKVYNYLDIRLPSSGIARSRDAAITTQLKTQLLATKGVSSNNIKVETTNSVVYLMGLVTEAEAESAARVAAKVGKVDKVVTLFDFVPRN